MDLRKSLSKQDLISILEIANKALLCTDLSELEKIILKLKSCLYFEHAFCTTLNQEEPLPLKVVAINYPQEFLSRYFEKEYYLCDHVSDELLSTFEVQHWGTVDKKYQSIEKREPATIEAMECGLIDGFSYGTLDADQTIATCFSFAGHSIENNERSRTIISYAVPHLSEALKRIVYQQKIKQSNLLTPKEKEVLHWLKEGKTNWEISMIVGRSERTINFHVTNAKRKLNASNRTQAVAKAISTGEIAF